MTDVAPRPSGGAARSGLPARLRARWTHGGPLDRAIVAVAIAVAAFLLGAFLFGLWHVLVGGFVRGNWRAGAFGIALALVTGALLAIGTGLARRRA